MLMETHAAINNKNKLNKLEANMPVEVRCGDGIMLCFCTVSYTT